MIRQGSDSRSGVGQDLWLGAGEGHSQEGEEGKLKINNLVSGNKSDKENLKNYKELNMSENNLPQKCNSF